MLGSSSEVRLHRLDMTAMECLGNYTFEKKMSFKCARVLAKQSQCLGKISAEVEIFIQALNLIFFFSPSLIAYPQMILSPSALYILKENQWSESRHTLRILTMNLFFAANCLVLIYFSMEINYLECWRCLQRNVTERLGNERGKFCSISAFHYLR